jgi:hypothetical protein
MVRGRSEAQKAHAKALATTRKAQSALLQVQAPATAQMTLLPKTRAQAGRKKLEELIQQKEALVDDLSSQLKVARGEITAFHLEIQQKDNVILELNLKIVTCKESEAAALSRSREFEISLENNILELRKVQKRSQRLTSERRLKKLNHDTKFRRLTAVITEAHQKHLETLAAHSLAEKKIQSLLTETERLNTVLSCEKSANYDLRKKAHRLDMQCSRAQASLRKYRSSLRSKTTWSAKKGDTYTAQARRLARELLKAGCSSERVGDAMLACAKAFGIKVRGKMSRRTVLRARDEGGYFGLMQLGREIIHSSGLFLVDRLFMVCR